ncbi:unnamed protein product [Closterium sp. NIES-54]
MSICACTRKGLHLVTFTRRPWSSLYTLATEPPQVAASAQVSVSCQVAASCSCRLGSHQTLLWHHRLGHPSLPRLRGMHFRLLVSGLPESLPPLPPSPATPCLPCVEGRQRAAPHSSSFPLTNAPLKGEVSAVLIPWIRTVRLQLRKRFGQDLPVLRLHFDRGGEFSSDLLWDFCRGEGTPWSTQWSLRRPVYGLRQAPREWHDTLRTTLAALEFAPSTADPSLFLRTNTSLPPFYVLVYVDDLLFATVGTKALTLVKSELQKRHTCTDYSSPQLTPLSTSHSLSAPPSDESVEPSGLYPELVGCLMYLMTCTRPDLAYPLSLLACYVAPGRHRKVHWDVAKRVLRYLCRTSGMGLVLGGRGPVVLTGHVDASWVDNSAKQRSSQGYTFSLGSGSVSWRSTRSSLVLSSSCEAEIYAGAMAAQELRWLTYLLTDLGEQPRSPLVLYVDNKAMIALC